ncbi:hypothetical protein ACFX11_026634 [Malus domestica]
MAFRARRATEGDVGDAIWVDAALDERLGRGHDPEGAEKARGFGGFVKRELQIWNEEEESGRLFAQNLGRSSISFPLLPFESNCQCRERQIFLVLLDRTTLEVSVKLPGKGTAAVAMEGKLEFESSKYGLAFIY